MAIKKIQKNRMNDAGTFDVIHYETDASQVLMADGTTAEAAITGKEAAGAAAQALVDAKSYTDNQIAGIPTPDVSGQINTHNTDANAHSSLFGAKADLVDGKVPYSELPEDLVSAIDEVAAHASDATIHVTAEEKAAWNESILLRSVSLTLPTFANWSSVTYGNGKFVAVTYNSAVAAYSDDGINWNQTTLPASVERYSVTYGNGKFVAVTFGGNIAAYSDDGINWTQSTLPTFANWQSVTYGNGKFVAVAYNSNISAYSEDGINWTQTTLPSSAYWASVTYGNGKFVAVAISNSNKVAYSEDGINWTGEQNVAVETVSGIDVTKDVKKILGLDNGVATPVKSVVVTLTSSGWDSTALTQTVTVSGVLADEAKQMIQPVPAMASQAAYIEAGILCTSQAADSLTFTAKAAPTGDLTVYVTIQEVVQG